MKTINIMFILVVIVLGGCGNTQRSPVQNEVTILGKWHIQDVAGNDYQHVATVGAAEYSKDGKYTINQEFRLKKGNRSATVSVKEQYEWKIKNGILYTRSVTGEIKKSSGDDEFIKIVEKRLKESLKANEWNEWIIHKLTKKILVIQPKDAAEGKDILEFSRP